MSGGVKSESKSESNINIPLLCFSVFSLIFLLIALLGSDNIILVLCSSFSLLVFLSLFIYVSYKNIFYTSFVPLVYCFLLTLYLFIAKIKPGYFGYILPCIIILFSLSLIGIGIQVVHDNNKNNEVNIYKDLTITFGIMCGMSFIVMIMYSLIRSNNMGTTWFYDTGDIPSLTDTALRNSSNISGVVFILSLIAVAITAGIHSNQQSKLSSTTPPSTP